MSWGFQALRISIVLLTTLIFSVGVEARLAKGSKFPMAYLSKLKPIATSKRGISSVKKSVQIDRLKNKVVYVDFWASWCPPCKESMPKYNTLYKKLKNRGVEFIGVNVDESAREGLEFMKKHPIKFPVVYDRGKKLISKLEVSMMPTAFIIDQQGNVHKVHEGFKAGDEKKIVRHIAALLKKSKKIKAKKK